MNRNNLKQNTNNGQEKLSIEQIEIELLKIIEKLSKKTINLDDNFKNSGFDSLLRLEAMAVIEKKFKIDLTEDIISEFDSVSRMARIVRDALSL